MLDAALRLESFEMQAEQPSPFGKIWTPNIRRASVFAPKMLRLDAPAEAGAGARHWCLRMDCQPLPEALDHLRKVREQQRF